MALKEMVVRMEGLSPLLMSAPTSCNPMSETTKALKAITSKRKKTDEDHAALMRAEWFSRLYVNSNGQVQIPPECVEGCIVAAAKKTRQGKDAICGITCESVSPLEYDGPKEPEKLFEDSRFISVKRVAVDRKAVMRCRPVFNQWACNVTILVDDTVLNPEHVASILETAGRIIGILDYRPRYGRFNVTILN